MLAAGVRAFGKAIDDIPSLGRTQEVQYLSQVFAQMRDEIEKTNRALLESERLATIGACQLCFSRPAALSRVSLRECRVLASPTVPANERAELYEEIRLAVNGTTDMLTRC